jgi:hypothetical protein
MAQSGDTLWVGGAKGFVATGDGRTMTRLTNDGDETVVSFAFVDVTHAYLGATRPLGDQRYARKVLFAGGADGPGGAGGRSAVARWSDESGSSAAPTHLLSAGDLWLGGIPLLRGDGTAFRQVPMGDDAPVDAIAAANGAGELWLAGGGAIRRFDGDVAVPAFGTGRTITAMAAGGGRAWAVGEYGTTLVFLPFGTPPR